MTIPSVVISALLAAGMIELYQWIGYPVFIVLMAGLFFYVYAIDVVAGGKL